MRTMIMAITYHHALGVGAGTRSGPSVFERFFNRLIESRQEEANRIVKQHMHSFSPETLRNIGYTDEDIQEIYKR